MVLWKETLKAKQPWLGILLKVPYGLKVVKEYASYTVFTQQDLLQIEGFLLAMIVLDTISTYYSVLNL